MPIQAPKRPPLPEATINAIEAYVRSEEISRVAPNRTAMIRDDLGHWIEVPRRWTPFSTLNLWTKFRLQHPQHPISVSKFYDAMPRDVSPTEKATDLCSDCELARKVTEILKSLRKEPQSADRDRNIENAEAMLELFEKHKKVALDQHVAEMSMNDVEENTQEKWILDYKENVELGIGPREEGQSFYNRPQRVVFGAVVRWKTANPQTHQTEIHTKYYDFVSPVLAKTGYATIQHIKKLLELRNQENPNLRHVELWMDNCGHFKSKEVIAWAAKQQAPTIALNFTWPQHGKSLCDSRFGQVSRFLERGSLKKLLLTTEDIIDTIREEQREANLYREAIDKPIINSAQLIVDFPTPDDHAEIYEFVGVKSFFHYSSDDDGQMWAAENYASLTNAWTLLDGEFVVQRRKDKDLARYRRGFDDIEEETRDSILRPPAGNAIGGQQRSQRKEDEVEATLLPFDRYNSDDDFVPESRPKRRRVSHTVDPPVDVNGDEIPVVEHIVDESRVERPRPKKRSHRRAVSEDEEDEEEGELATKFSQIVENAKQRRKQQAWSGTSYSGAIWEHAVDAMNKRGHQSSDDKNFVDMMSMMARDLSRKNGSTQVSSAQLEQLAAERRLRPLIELSKELQDLEEDDE